MNEFSDFELHTQEDWTPLGELTGIREPLFEATLFLFGYDFSSNIYLLCGPEEYAIIDPGNDYPAYMQMVQRGIKPTDIKKIAVTHGHHDHVMGAVELFRGHRGFGTPELEIIMHEAGPLEFKEMMQNLGCRITEVKGGETIILAGFELEVIHTPGHTIDGLCFYHAPSRTLFSGDTVLPTILAEPDTKAAGGSMAHYFYSLRILRQRQIDHILPGHGGVAPRIGRFVVDETYDALIKRVVGLETPFFEGATQLAQQGLLEEALFYLDRELAQETPQPRALEMKGFLLNDLGRGQEALDIFDRILRQEPDHAQALLGKGVALLGLGRYEDSLTALNRAAALRPDLKEVQVYQGMALYLSGREAEALDLPAFGEEFTRRLKDELARLAQSRPSP
ncbi:MAG: MBL fold metallo-hydrolase [Syntrophobacterales bacterium]|nr:MBL fold metallo-hydrolase [Syntrophobacterales bacterium]